MQAGPLTERRQRAAEGVAVDEQPERARGGDPALRRGARARVTLARLCHASSRSGVRRAPVIHLAPEARLLREEVLRRVVHRAQQRRPQLLWCGPAGYNHARTHTCSL